MVPARRDRAPLRWAPLLALVASCGAPPAVRPLDLGGAPDGVGFMVVLGADRAVLGVEGPFGLEDGKLSFGARPQVALTEGGGAVVLVVPTAALVAALPGFTAADLPESRLTASPPHRPAVLADGRVEEALPLPASTRFWRADDAGAGEVGPAEVADALAKLELRVAYDPEACRPPGTGILTPFGGVSDPIAEVQDPLASTLRDVVVVDRDRVLTYGTGAIFVLDRGVPLRPADTEGAPRRVFTVRDLIGPRSTGVDVDAIALDPTSPPDARRLAVVLGEVDPNAEPRQVTGYLVWLTLTQRGLTLVETGTVTPDVRLRDVSFAPDGRWMLSGDGGVVFFGAPGATRPVASRYAEPTVSEARRGTWTPDPERPWVITARSMFHTYFETVQRWVAQPARGQVDENLYFIGLAAAEVDGQVEIWSGGAGGLLYASRGGGEFEFVSPRTPPRLGACSQQLGEARPLYVQDVSDVALADGRVFLVSDDCTALMQVRLSDGCSSLLSVAGAEILGANRVLRGLDIQDGLLVAVGRNGKVWETTLR